MLYLKYIIIISSFLFEMDTDKFYLKILTFSDKGALDKQELEPLRMKDNDSMKMDKERGEGKAERKEKRKRQLECEDAWPKHHLKKRTETGIRKKAFSQKLSLIIHT